MEVLLSRRQALIGGSSSLFESVFVSAKKSFNKSFNVIAGKMGRFANVTHVESSVLGFSFRDKGGFVLVLTCSHMQEPL